MSTPVPSTPRALRGLPLGSVAMAAVMGTALVLSGCSAGSSPKGAAPGEGRTPASAASGPTGTAPAGGLKANVHKRQHDVPVDLRVAVRGTHGRLQAVSLASASGATVEGTTAADGSSWRADSLLEPGTSYVLKAALSGEDGATVNLTRRFRTRSLTLGQQTFASISPLAGQTVGVGFPVVVHFDVPVTDRAAIERHLSVDAQPAQQGAWHWFSDTEVHWRPKHYWKVGSTVTVHAAINSVPAGNGVYGQSDRDVTFHVGDRHIYLVDMKTDQMKVYANDKLLRTIAVTTGQPGFITRSGIKVIVQKYAKHTMNSETIGIPQGDPNYYNVKDVQWAMRMTFSGEFIHAAPWSVSSQGHANVSHGCTGMSTADAGWLFHLTRVGDVVKEFGTDRPMEITNGYGDWNLSFKDYRAGSALS